MNTEPQKQEPRKHAMITAEQEALMRAMEQAKKMDFGEITIYIQTGKITRYEIRKSKLNQGSQKSNADMLKEAEEDMGDFETVAI
ncbi:MAG TPA: hypothetical protein VMR49_03140 [Candidatus Paceibacterota bacterium]|nr:hypothetical protein [Candidatus Paceibacterota bacterium]